MKHYHTLIKLKQQEIDQLRSQLMDLGEQREFFEQLITQLQKDLEQEVTLAGSLVDMGVFFGDYSESNKEKQQKLREQVHRIDAQMNLLSERVMVFFGEQKKFEIALKAQQDAIAKKEAKKEQDVLDEISAKRRAIQE